MIQAMVLVALGPHETPHRQIWKATETLPSGSSVLVLTNDCLPLDTGDYAWCRPDVNIQLATPPKHYELWDAYAHIVGGDQGGDK